MQKQTETSRDEGSAPRERTSGVYSWSKSHPRSRAPFLLGTFGRVPCGQQARWKWVAEQMSSHREAGLRAAHSLLPPQGSVPPLEVGWIWSPDVGVECKGYLRWESLVTNRNFDLVFLLLLLVCFVLTAYSSKGESTYSSVVWSHRKQDYDQNLIRRLVRTEQGRMFWKIY